MIEELYFGKEARDKIIEGINDLNKAVSSTMGPNGATVIIPNKNKYGEYIITKDGVSVAEQITFKDPLKNIGANLIKQVAKKTVEDAGDGPQPLYAKVLTPNGFVKISDLKINDEICGTNKTIQKVIGIYPKGNLKVYKLKFNNGQIVECSENHIWNVNTNWGKNKNLTVKEIINYGVKSLNKDGSNTYNFYIPNTTVEFSKKEQILDPFLVGLLLGDGSLCKTGSIELSLALDQKYILDNIILPEGIKLTYSENLIKHYLRVKFSRINDSGPTMHDYIEQIGLLDHKSGDKFIPDNYKYSDYDSRLKLLNGLTETDGHVNKRGLLEYNTISEKLFNDVRELLSGLGKQSHGYLMNRKLNSSYSSTPIYRISELKGYKYGIKLIDIEETNSFEDMMCIKVSNTDSLYITNNYIITHNTTTSIVLATAFVNNLKDFKSVDINKAFDEIIPKVIEQLKLNSRELKHEDIKHVASISANNDLQIGELIQQAYNHSDIVKIEESSNTEDVLDTFPGMLIPVSYFSKHFITNESKGVCDLINVNTLIIDGKLEKLENFRSVLELTQQPNNSLLIIVEDIHEQALRKLETFVLNQSLPICVIKSPGFSKHRKDLLQDISKFTGSTLITDLSKSYNIDVLGKLQSCKISKNNSILVKDESIDVSNKLKSLDELSNDKDLTEHDRDLIEQRIEYLKGKVSIIKVGGKSELEMKERFDRYDDAVKAVACALEEGIVEGGGIALFRSCNFLWDDYLNDSCETKILNSLSSPLNTIKENGYMNFKSNTMFEQNIIDPLKVTRCALENAVSVAKVILSTEAVVLNQEQWMS